MTTSDDDRLVTVCAECHLAACWQGIFMCQWAYMADTKEMPIGELRKLNLEHPDYWTPHAEVCGPGQDGTSCCGEQVRAGGCS